MKFHIRNLVKQATIAKKAGSRNNKNSIRNWDEEVSSYFTSGLGDFLLGDKPYRYRNYYVYHGKRSGKNFRFKSGAEDSGIPRDTLAKIKEEELESGEIGESKSLINIPTDYATKVKLRLEFQKELEIAHMGSESKMRYLGLCRCILGSIKTLSFRVS